jgi:hypothetical protein
LEQLQFEFVAPPVRVAAEWNTPLARALERAEDDHPPVEGRGIDPDSDIGW